MKKSARLKIVAIIQARVKSTRLPNKVLMEISGKPLIWYLVNAMKKSKLVDKIVLATTNKLKDKILLQKAKEFGIKGFAGSEKDVLDRYYQAAKKFKADIVVRATGDCPLMDTRIVDKTITAFLGSKCDFACNRRPPTYPDGFDIDVMSFKSLERAWKEAKLSSDREHVVTFFWNNPGKFKLLNVENETDLSMHRWTVDEKKDFEFVKKIIEKLNGKQINLENVLEIIKKFPELSQINKSVSRDEGYAKSLEMNKMRKKIVDFKKSLGLLKKAKELIPSASQTYSKSYKYYCEGAAPVFIERGNGSHVWDIDNNEFIDFVCALGAITVGYNIEEINSAISKQLKKGISFSLPSSLEVELAEKLIKTIPSAEMVRFVKNGSDATTAAIRLARAFTGKEIIARCGYHGFQDWHIGSTENNLGVPTAVQELTKTFNYNGIDSLQKIFDENQNKIAGIILEPYQENGPEKNFLQEIKKIAQENSALLIFDEVKSGFRLALAGAQEYFKITPDLSAFGKGMANGAAISAVVGKKEIMQLIDKGVFVSTTFGGETLSIAAALATIKILEKPNSFKKIWKSGDNWKKGIKKLIDKKNLSETVEIVGLAPHCGVKFKGNSKLSNHELFSVYQQELIERGILSLGINDFCLAHSAKDIKEFVSAADSAFDNVNEALRVNSIEGLLKGERFRPIFKR